MKSLNKRKLISVFLLFFLSTSLSGCLDLEKAKKKDYGEIEIVNDSKSGTSSKTLNEKYEIKISPESFVNGLKKYYNGNITVKKDNTNIIDAGKVSIDLKGGKIAKVFFVKKLTTHEDLRNFKEILKYTIYKLVDMDDEDKIQSSDFVNKSFEYILNKENKNESTNEFSLKAKNNKTIYFKAGKNYPASESGVIIEVK